LTADLAIATVAAFAPEDFQVTLCEETVEPVDFSRQAEFVALTGKITQWRRTREIAAQFRARGVCVIIGGPMPP